MARDQNLTIIEKEKMYQQIVEYSFETTIIHCNEKVIYINQSGANFLGATKEEIIGKNIVEVFLEDSKRMIRERIRKATEENVIGDLIETTIQKFDGSLVEVELYCHPVKFGESNAIQSIIRDITSRKEAEKKLREMVREIATPIVPVFEGIAVIPLVGNVDLDRTNQLVTIIPQKMQGHNLEHLIIDVSGIYNIDETVIDFIYEINSIMKLLGISLIFTGLRPELAHKAVEARMNITSIKTKSTVKQALEQLIQL
ncbi:PAS domain S-box protein [Alkalihalobacterium bogoriense]|uniref:PAS domain S-box protein n=1 Tax=Alkalihalobacterium bogoriense TaxID=246272 RepID=UPI000554F7E9|nr:PAS domain S-box protein [Alkalihalobacterium bogoriense]